MKTFRWFVSRSIKRHQLMSVFKQKTISTPLWQNREMAQVSSTEDGLSSVLVKSERKGTGTQGGVAGEQKAFYKTLKAERVTYYVQIERAWREQIQSVVCPEHLTSCTRLTSFFCSSPAPTFTGAKLLCRQLLLQRLLLLLPPPASPTFPLHAVRALLWVLVRGHWVQMPQSGSISAEVWTFCASKQWVPTTETYHSSTVRLPASDTALCSDGLVEM